MEERNKIIFQINHKNKPYSITTFLTGNRINIECTDQNSQIFENNYTLQELLNLSKYFHPTHTLEQIQLYINGIIEKQKIGINQGEDAMSLIFFLINNDQISIPLLKKTNPLFIRPTTHSSPPLKSNNISNYPLTRYNSMTHSNLNSSPNISPFIYNQTTNKVPVNPNKALQQQQQQQKIKANNTLNNNINNISINNNQNQSQSNKNINTNEIQKLKEEINKLKEQNEVYKTDHGSLTNENALLKTENDNIKKQILTIQNENKALKESILKLNNQIEGYNKNMDALENQNDEIRKMYTDLENEFNEYKNKNFNEENINKENELLRNQIEELNNNFIMINKELENIRNENEIFKNNLEQQKQNLNEDVVNKLIEENNLLKNKLEENEYLKKQIEELQYQLQYQTQNQEDNQINSNMNSQISNNNENINKKDTLTINNENIDNENDAEEEKGEIIHDMKELELITNKINSNNKKITINLLYKASVDGDKASIFHEKCDQAQSTIVLVETLKGKRFGGFTTQSWSGNCEDKNDADAFVFSLDKMETYDNIPGDEAIGCYPKFGPIFLGCQIKIFDNAFSKGGTTFEKELNFNTKEDYELTGGERLFQIKDIEVYEVILE